MATHTIISRKEITAILNNYAIKKLISYHGITGGIENSNYALVVENQKFQLTKLILTIIENNSLEKLRNIIKLHDTLHNLNFCTPQILRDRNNSSIHMLGAKPVILQTCLAGQHILTPSELHCQQIGKFLGEMHKIPTQKLALSPWEYGPDWWQHCCQRLSGNLPIKNIQLIQSITQHFQQLPQLSILPKGLMHGDLFRDNALFVENQLSGVIDFYHACEEWLLMDLAITINDWCTDEIGKLDCARYEGFLRGYESERQLTVDEKKLLPEFLKAAALRFWLSRLMRWYFEPQIAIEFKKSPDEYYQILLMHLSAR